MKYCPMHYSATTDILPFYYLPEGKVDFTEHHATRLIDKIYDLEYKNYQNTI